MKKHLFLIITALIFGMLAKSVAFIPGNSLPAYLGARDTINYVGVIIAIVCFFEYSGKTVKQSMLHTLGFMAAMVAGYYLVASAAFGFIPYGDLMLWELVALCSPLLCLCVSLRRKNSFLAFAGTLIPALLLGSAAYRLMDTGHIASLQLWFDIAALIILFIKLPASRKDRLYAIILFVVCIPILNYFNVIRWIATFTGILNQL